VHTNDFFSTFDIIILLLSCRSRVLVSQFTRTARIRLNRR